MAMQQDFENQRHKKDNIQEAYSHSEFLIEKAESGMKEGETPRPVERTNKKTKLPAFLFSLMYGLSGLLFVILGFCVFTKVILANVLWLGIIFLILGVGILLSDYFIYKKI